MKKIFFLLSFLGIAFVNAGANDSCKIYFNKKLISKVRVDHDKSVAYLSSRSPKKTDCITVRYFSENVNKGWKRTIYFNARDERNIRTVEMDKQDGSVSVRASLFREMMEKKEPVFIYTMSLPADKALASRIRVRRMLICKLEWN